MQQIDDFRGKTALITGAADGIGAALAEALAAAGARVFASDIDAAKLEATASRLGLEHAVCDVADEAAVEALVERAWGALGPIDLLCANAGVIVPGSLLDVERAVKWIREEIGNYGGDPNFIVATGGSAGGHLSSLLSLTANDPAYQPGFEQTDTSINGCVPFYGVYDFTDTYELQVHGGLLDVLQKTVFKKSLETDREAFLSASPMHRIHTDAPPMFVIHGDQDGLAPVEEARHFVKLLRETSKSPVAYAEIPGAQHAFDIFHSDRSSIVAEGVSRFLSTLHSDYKLHGPSFNRGTTPQAPR